MDIQPAFRISQLACSDSIVVIALISQKTRISGSDFGTVIIPR